MTTKPFVHSYSAGKMFEQCPHRFHEDRVLRRFPFVQGPEAKEGDEIHKAMERYIKHETAFPRRYEYLEPIAVEAHAMPGVKQVESKWGLTKQFTPCGYFDDEVYYRYRNDFVTVEENAATLIDWKTGKASYPDIDQLVEGAVCLMLHNPDVDEVKAALVFMKHDVVEVRHYTREFLDDYVDDMAAKYAEIDAVMKEGEYEKTPSALCPWCPVEECEFWTPRKSK